jgi:hypothetical protein
MTLGNMRANGVRSVDVWCLGRGWHDYDVNDICYWGISRPNAGMPKSTLMSHQQTFVELSVR